MTVRGVCDAPAEVATVSLIILLPFCLGLFLLRYWKRRKSVRESSATLNRRRTTRRCPRSARREPRRRGERRSHSSQLLLFTFVCPLFFCIFLNVVISVIYCRGSRGSQGGEPYSPYDFSENQDVPDSKYCAVFFCLQII